MAKVNSYGDIPGNVTSASVCDIYATACGKAEDLLEKLISSYSNIKYIVDTVIKNVGDVGTKVNSACTNFKNGAYNDGSCTYVEDLGTYFTELSAVKTDLTSLSDQLGKAIQDASSLSSFCGERGDTWESAASFIRIEEMLRERDRRY